jgi:uncharacterized Zn finger protein
MGYYGGWAPYVPVAERRAIAAEKIKKMQKKGQRFNPIHIEGRTIAKTFWGKAWCDNLENYSDYENRLPRGRTYVRNGSVIDLQVTKGKVNAQVMGSSLYKVVIEVKPMPNNKWKNLVKVCAGKIDSLIELLQCKFSKAVMSILIDKEAELFPSPQEISMSCSCPDYAGMCKHIAAVLYGIGAAIDTNPEWLFSLRHVDHLKLLASAATSEILSTTQPSSNAIGDGDLSTIFGIEMEEPIAVTPKKAASSTRSLGKGKKTKKRAKRAKK